jgi:iron complex outermembrane receptor protein
MNPESSHIMTSRSLLLASASLLICSTAPGLAEDPVQLPTVAVEATLPPPPDGSADAGYRVPKADLGPLGKKKELDTPFSLTDIPSALVEEHQDMNVSQIIKYNPSAQLEPRVDLDSGRPQTRGFENANIQNTRIDGFNSYTIMAYPMEDYENLQILNGAAGALYGPSSPAGTFNFISKRPTETPFNRLTFGFDSNDLFTEHGEFSGADGRFGYRLNAVHTEGESYVSTSRLYREVLDGNFDVQLADDTKLELNNGYYQMHETGLPAALVYGNGKIPTSTGIPSAGATLAPSLPSALDPTKAGYGIKGAGEEMEAYDSNVKLIHDLNDDWKLTAGAMYQKFSGTYGPAGTYGAADPGNWLMNNGKIATIVADVWRQSEVESDLAYLNGHVESWGLSHDLLIGTNGYQNFAYNRRGQNYQVGTSSLLAPTVESVPSFSNQGAQWKSGYTGEQSVVLGDTVKFDQHWSVLVSAAGSWLRNISYGTKTITSGSSYVVVPTGVNTAYNAYGVSPMGSLIYKPVEAVTTYVTYSNALQQGDTLTSSGGTGNTLLPPYRSTQWEAGAKATLNDRLDLSAALFHMKRPYAYDVGSGATTVLNTSGEQVNDGLETMLKGKVTEQLTLFGGVTFIDPLLENTADPTTANKLVVSVPKWQANLYGEYALDEVPGLSLNANIHYTGRRAANVTNTSWAAPYSTLDLGALWRMSLYGHDVTWRTGIDNVTNQHYWAAILPETTGGSSSQAGATGTVYEAIMGAPLTLHASVSVDF